MPKGGRRSTSFKPGVLALRVGAPIGKRRSPKRGRCSGIAASSLDTRGPPSGQTGARRHREYLGGDNPVFRHRKRRNAQMRDAYWAGVATHTKRADSDSADDGAHC